MNKPNLVLDLDETLVTTYNYNSEYIDSLLSFSYLDKLNICLTKPELSSIILPDHYFQINNLLLLYFKHNKNVFITYKRPYLFEFLIEANKYFNLYIYSLGHSKYVNSVINHIIDTLQYNPFITVFGNSIHDYKLVKNLSYINIDTALIIDDRADVWNNDINSVYKIKRFHNNQNDQELFNLMNKIKSYFLINSFNLKEILKYFDN